MIHVCFDWKLLLLYSNGTTETLSMSCISANMYTCGCSEKNMLTEHFVQVLSDSVICVWREDILCEEKVRSQCENATNSHSLLLLFLFQQENVMFDYTHESLTTFPVCHSHIGGEFHCFTAFGAQLPLCLWTDLIWYHAHCMKTNLPDIFVELSWDQPHHVIYLTQWREVR